MFQRCRRDSQRGAKVLYLRMDINCRKCEKEEKEQPEEAEVVDIEVNDVFIQVLRGSAEPVIVDRPHGLRVERRDQVEKAKSDEVVVGRRE